jgi:ABC-type methionine transport system ATPase subunit
MPKRGDSFNSFRKFYRMSILNNETRVHHDRVADPDYDRNDLIFEVDHLSLVYPGGRGHPAVEILNDVSFSVKRGHALTLVGPSGSGKSSVLRCLNRLVEATSGTVRFDGRDIRLFDPRELRCRVALVMQTPVMFEGTVRDNLCIRPAGVTGDFSENRLAATLDEVGLESKLLDREAATLSGGEKQRVTIARALLRDPQALLLDEPTSALDPPNVLLVVDTISRLRAARGLSIVAVTHQPDLVRRLGGSLLYLIKGHVEAIQSLDGSDAGEALDARLQAFLAGEKIVGGSGRP